MRDFGSLRAGMASRDFSCRLYWLSASDFVRWSPPPPEQFPDPCRPAIRARFGRRSADISLKTGNFFHNPLLNSRKPQFSQDLQGFLGGAAANGPFGNREFSHRNREFWEGIRGKSFPLLSAPVGSNWRSSTCGRSAKKDRPRRTAGPMCLKSV